ncbi:MAG: hypothetical protein J6B77_08760, partial [Clostridia bacterium]|nr:hypothetical protein [Clostridia bacterium]
MENVILVENWKLAIVPHSDVRNGFYAKTIDELRLSGRRIFDASVPGNFELDLVREGMLDDPYYGENILKLQKLEHLHLWYFTTFSAEERENTEISLCFEGIDTASEIYLDGVLLGKTENMLIPHAFPLNELSAGEHQLVVHIIPAAVYARNFDLPLSLQAQLFNMDSLVLRKAPYMYGWDIVPRALSAGLWRPVRLVYRPKDRIAELYLSTYEVNTVSTEEKPTFAKLRLFLRVESDADLLTDFTFRIDGKCGESEFHKTGKIWGTTAFTSFKVDNAKFWMPKNYGEPNLYDVRVTLLCGDTVCDTCDMRFGIRIVELDRTSLAGEAGEFCFRINGCKIFVNGTNWVPTDAFPSQHDRYLARDLAMLDDIGCNMVRWWGGNVYPTEEFYDFCDEHGILIWQDFAMACGIYPNDARMMRLIREEATVIVRKFRNHAALALWSGDNECDETTYYRQMKVNGRKIVPTDPNDNRLTREVLAEVIREN